MDPEHWKRIEEVYHAAVVRAPGEREVLLEGACAGDDALRREVEALLAVSTEGRPETPALAGAAHMVSDPAASALTRSGNALIPCRAFSFTAMSMGAPTDTMNPPTCCSVTKRLIRSHSALPSGT